MERVDAAARLFREGRGCAQSPPAAFGPDAGLDREAALRLASPLAGGLNRTDVPCTAAVRTAGEIVLDLLRGEPR